jgi:PAS domain S-box-containing protein
VVPVDTGRGNFDRRMATVRERAAVADYAAQTGEGDGAGAERYLSLPDGGTARHYRRETHRIDGGRRLEVLVEVTDAVDRTDRLATFQSLAKGVQDGVYVLDETGTIEFCNESYASMFGYEPAELVGEHVTALYSEAAFERGREAVERIRSEPERESLGIELVGQRRDGEPVDVSVHFAIRRSEQGSFAGVLCVARDVTERKERERALERATSRYRTLVENFPNGAVALFDTDLRYTLVEGTIFERMEIDAADLEGERIAEAHSGAFVDAHLDHYRAALDGERRTFEFAFGDRTFRGHVLPVRNEDGEVVSGLSMSQEITDQREHERSLERANSRYRTLIENFPDGNVFLFDEDLTYTIAGGTELGGEAMSAADFEGSTPRDLFTGELADSLVDSYRAALDGERTVMERSFAGEEYRIRVVPVRDEDGTVVSGMAVAQNVTEEKAREARLRAVREQMELALEATDAVVWEMDVDTESVTYYPDVPQKLYGSRIDSRDEFYEQVHPEDRDRVEASVQSALQEPVPGTYQAEFRTVIDGETEWRFARGRVETDADGEPARLYGVTRDITARKEREEELRAVRERMELALEATDAVAWTWDPETDEVVMYPESSSLYDGAVVTAADAIEGIHPEDRQALREAAEAAIEEGETFDTEFRLEGEDGTRWIADRGRIVTDDADEPVGAYGVAYDVTERKRQEQALERAKSRYQTLAENFPDGGVFLFDADLRFVLAGGTGIEAAGLSAAEFEGSTPYDVFSEEVATRLAQHFRRALEGHHDTFDLTYRDRHYRVQTVPVRDDDGAVVSGMAVSQDVTERRERQAALRRERDKLSRLETVVASVQPLTETLTRATTRDTLEEELCARLAESTAYAAAWIGAVPAVGSRVRPRASAGLPDGPLLDPSLEGEEETPVGRAIRTEEPAVSADGDRSVVVIPLTYRSTTHGVLALHCDQPEALTERELSVLGGLGRRIGQALTALQSRRLLETDRSVEVRFRETEGATTLAAAAAAADCTLVLRGLTQVDGDVSLFHLAVEDGETGAAAAALAGTEGVGSVRTLGDGEDATLQCRYRGTCSLDVLLDHGGAIGTARFAPSESTVVADFALGTDIGAVVDAVTSVLPAFEAVSKREHEGSSGEWRSNPPDLRTRLTERQLEVVEAAYHAGYFEWPRETTAEELAAALDIASPTLHQHLRKAHRRLVTALVEAPGSHRATLAV